MVEKLGYRVCQKLFISPRFDFNETINSPIKWKTRSLVKIESLGKINNFLTDSAFSTLGTGHKVTARVGRRKNRF